MKVSRFFKFIKKQKFPLLYLAHSLIITFFALLYCATLDKDLLFIQIIKDSGDAFLLFAVFAALTIIIPMLEDRKVLQSRQRILWTLLPGAIILAIQSTLLSPKMHFIAGFFASLVIFGLLFELLFATTKSSIKKTFLTLVYLGKFQEERKKNIFALSCVILIFALYLGFGTFHLGKFAAVDEPLWTFGRIGKFWNNVSDGEWHKTSVSDKPGITVAIISGTGLLTHDPDQYEPKRSNGNYYAQNKLSIEDFNIAFRFPILLATALGIFPLFFLLRRLFGTKTALIGSSFMYLSPLLLGISTIINPDALLWIFTILSFLSYMVYLKDQSKGHLYWSGIFLGLSLLTKYIANLFIVYYFALVFIYPVFQTKESREVVFKRMFGDYFALLLFAFFTYFAFLPAAWNDLLHIVDGTILSKAFLKTWPIFVSLIAISLFDIFLLKNILSKKILDFFANYKKPVIAIILLAFVFFSLLTFTNTYLGMKWFDFESIIASPKTSIGQASFFGFMGANFYSMIFGITPLALLAVFYAIFAVIKKSDREETFLVATTTLLILLYYFASTANSVSATVRYQIMIFPLVFLLAALGLKAFSEDLKLTTKRFAFPVIFATVVFSSLWGLFTIKPFYFSYASTLLPKEYVLNLKDMGDGSYEAAQYLNSLPNAQSLRVWTDKRGVCVFFLGSCSSDVDFEKKGKEFDYFVVSAGRESRTSKMTMNRAGTIRLYELYSFDKPEYKLEIGGRPNNFVKVIKTDVFLGK